LFSRLEENLTTSFVKAATSLKLLRISPKNVSIYPMYLNTNGLPHGDPTFAKLVPIIVAQMPGNQTFAVDLNAAQFGWRDLVAPLDDFLRFRAHALDGPPRNIISALRSLESLKTEVPMDHSMSRNLCAMEETTELAVNAIRSYLEGCSGDQTMSMRGLLSLPHDQFAGHRNEILDKVMARLETWRLDAAGR
jgi:hypothetical protein